MSIEDRLSMLAILGLRIGVSEDRTRLTVDGPSAVVDTALPTIRQHKSDLLFYLRNVAA